MVIGLDKARTKADIEDWLDMYADKDQQMGQKLLENFILEKSGKKPKIYGPNSRGYYYACKPYNSYQKVFAKTRIELLKKLTLYYSDEREIKKGPLTFAEMWNEWMDYRRLCMATPTERGLSPLTITKQETDYNRFFAGSELEKMKLPDITTAVLNDTFLRIIIAKKIQKRAFTNILGYINDMFERAIDSGYINNNPCARVNRKLLRLKCAEPPLKDDEDRILTTEQYNALMTEILKQEQKHPKNMCNYAIELAMYTGLRVGELAALRRGDIRSGFLHVEYSEHEIRQRGKRTEYYIAEPKNHRHRAIPLTAKMEQVIAKIDAVSSPSADDFLFRDLQTGEKKTPHAIARATTRRGEWAGIEKVSIHRIRRTVASNLIINGVPPLVVSDWLGHEPEVDARHYQYNTLTLAEQRRLLEDTETKIIPFREAV